MLILNVNIKINGIQIYSFEKFHGPLKRGW